MPDLLTTLLDAFTLAFAVTSMFSMGLGLTSAEIVDSLSNARLVILALVANFLIVPAAAIALAILLVADPSLSIGLLLVSMVAGSPFSPRLALLAKGNVPLAVGMMALLVVGTVLYLPIALPLALPGARVGALSIAAPLFLQLLLPLGLGLFINERYQEEAETIQPLVAQIANISLALILVLLLVGNIGNVLGLLGSGAIIALLLLVAIALLTGYYVGGPNPANRRALALNTGQRNLAAAFVIATTNFANQPGVLVMLATAGLLVTVVNLLVAGEFGRRAGFPTSGPPRR